MTWNARGGIIICEDAVSETTAGFEYVQYIISSTYEYD
jgi:hypothetical protein